MSRTGQHSITEKLTVASLAIIGIGMLLLSRDFSMSGDEASQMQIGRNIYVYLGRTLGLIPGSPAGIKLDNYGALFGVISTGLAHLLPWANEIYLRHFLIAITGFFTIVYTGKTAHLLHSRKAALICIWMLACSPRFFGAGMNDSKDIPFALGMIMSTYFLLRIIKDAPVIVRKHFAGLFLGLFIAIGVRIGGLMFGLYALPAFGYLARQHARSYALKLAVWMSGTSLAAFLAAIIFLPKAWPDIPLNTLKALHNFSNYRVALTMLYMGRDLPTWEPPWHYLPVWIGITLPVAVLLLFLLSPLLLGRQEAFSKLLLFLTVLFPWLSIVAIHSPVYDAWRQFYFIYPPMVVLAGMAAAAVFSLMRQHWQQWTFGGILAVNLLLPVAWSIRNHPLEHVYFNELIGGVDGAYGHFETDYYGDGVELSCKKLLRQPAFKKPLTDSVYVLNNVPTQIIYYLKKYDPRISVIHTAYERREGYRWDYGIFYTRGLDTLLKRTDWPPAGMIDSVVADHTLLIAIVKHADPPTQ